MSCVAVSGHLLACCLMIFEEQVQVSSLRLVRKEGFHLASKSVPSEGIQAHSGKAVFPAHVQEYKGPPSKLNMWHCFEVHPGPLQLIHTTETETQPSMARRKPVVARVAHIFC